MAYRDEIDALSARANALQLDLEDRARELEDARRKLEDAKARAKLPLLDDIRVATPCRADWDKMVGDARARACVECLMPVYNISEMTREEAQALLIEREGRLCVRYYQRKDGTILLKDCVIGVKRRRRNRLIAASAAITIAGAALGVGTQGAEVVTMGAIDAEPQAVVAPPPTLLATTPVATSDYAVIQGGVSIRAESAASPPRETKHKAKKHRPR
jgi:hypothetical protein